MFGMGMYEVMIIGVIAIVLFGSKLPEVARSLGSSYREFRKGLGDIQSSMQDGYYAATSTDYTPSYDLEEDDAATSKFEPPPAEDRDEPSAPRFQPPES